MYQCYNSLSSCLNATLIASEAHAFLNFISKFFSML